LALSGLEQRSGNPEREENDAVSIQALHQHVKVLAFRSLQKTSGSFLKKESNLVACNDVDVLMTAMHINHKPEEWRLFIDSSK
jgi:hypothetical protein